MDEAPPQSAAAPAVYALQLGQPGSQPLACPPVSVSVSMCVVHECSTFHVRHLATGHRCHCRRRCRCRRSRWPRKIEKLTSMKSAIKVGHNRQTDAVVIRARREDDNRQQLGRRCLHLSCAKPKPIGPPSAPTLVPLGGILICF